MHAVIATGTGRYSDPWHPYPDTSARIAPLLETAGFDIVDLPVEEALASLDGASLLVVNAGDPWRADTPEGEADVPDPASIAAASAGLASALDRGIGVIGVHAAVSSLRDMPSWAPAIGGMWIPSLSWHPPFGEVRVDVTGADVLEPGEFTVQDERYLRIQQFGERRVAATFTVEGQKHPAIWVRTQGASRVACDLLGHDVRSWESAGHRRAFLDLARWAAASAAERVA